MSHTIEMNRTQVEQTGARIAMNWINGEWVDAGQAFRQLRSCNG